MARLDIDIFGMCEIRWTGAGCFKPDDYFMYYSGSTSHERGVGILLNKEAQKSVIGFWPTTDRVMIIKLKAKPFNINLIQVYAPTSSSSDEELEEFCNNIDGCLRQCRSLEINIVMGDFNAKAGVETHASKAGGKSIGSRNKRGEQLIEWCKQNDQYVVHKTPTILVDMEERRWSNKKPNCLYNY